MANYRKVIPFFLKKEGGLSRAGTDSASSNPSPCVIGGVTGWHTNKGVTWGSFTGNAAKVGYSPSCTNFANMPPSIWEGIFKKSYWDFWGSDDIKYQPIADFMTWTVWGSGGGSFNNRSGSQGFLRRFLNDRGYNPQSKAEIKSTMMHLAKKNERKLWEDLIQERRDFYARLNQPANYKGWMNAVSKYEKWGNENYSFGSNLLSLKFLLPVGGIAATLIYLYKTDQL